MPDLNVRGVDESLMRKLKVYAAENGLTLRDWVIRALWRSVNGTYGEGGAGVIEDVGCVGGGEGGVGEEPEVGEDPVSGVDEEGEIAGGEGEEASSCPDCGSVMVWNKLFPWWECPGCGYHGKKGKR